VSNRGGRRLRLSQSEIEGFRLQWQQKRCPDEKARIGALERVAVHLQRRGSLLIGHQRKMSNPGIV
jgi:hypothetical protein